MSQSHPKSSGMQESLKCLQVTGMFLSCSAACEAQSGHAELLKAPYKTLSVRTHHPSLLKPQNPLTAPKWLLLSCFFLCSMSVYKWPHSVLVLLLNSSIITKKGIAIGGTKGCFVGAFRLCMNTSDGF